METIEFNGKKYKEVVGHSDRVLVRCRNAGVHVGTLVSRDSDTVVLKDSNRIWKWGGAFTLSEIATKGVNRDKSRIACEVPMITLTTSDVAEIIPVSDGVDLTEVNSAK